ncbi:MAG: SPFH domain-containing protein [Candidatus Loosdrechtia sp.]|uniref:SPFH domain-containing protein n=1 Tax=Candidatus Loosdrechtia sp. TaxID=3101272 RepID=UPI003A6D56FE|nr:MAG: SPFH domain-containing protein [Candidatus Jettenia sp. AMX2]
MDKYFTSKNKYPYIYRNIIIAVIVIAIIVGGIYGGRELSWKEIAPDEVAVIVNNLTGGIKLVDRAGAIVYYPFIQDIYILDKREQVLRMTAAEIDERHPQGNPLIVKTIDGGDVVLDIQVQYRLKPEFAIFIVQNTGVGDIYKTKWLYDYARTICYYTYGELTLDEFPIATARDEKARKAANEINHALEPHGFYVTSINLTDYRYYREYAEKIQERRLADKEVEEQEMRARAARENQRRVIVEETRRMEVEIARFRGEVDKRLMDARGIAEAKRQDADAYLIRKRFEGDAEFQRLVKQADAVLATVTAEAEGIKALRDALEGDGGRNLVRLEYAKRLKQAIVRSTPIIRQGIETPQSIQRFKYIEDAPKIDYMFPEPPDAVLHSPLKPGPDKTP